MGCFLNVIETIARPFTPPLPPSAAREKIECEITITDEKIDEIVYGLYGLTDEEKRIIGESLSG